MSNQIEMAMYRCTRNHPYRHKQCSGHDNPSIRYGHFILAFDIDNALEEMARRYPEDVMKYGKLAEAFTVEKK
jgi:hypothetical protein